MKLDHTHKNRFKMDYGLKFRPDAIKILEENIGSKIWDIARSNILPDVSPQARQTKETTNECINGWSNNSMFLSLSQNQLKKIFLMF